MIPWSEQLTETIIRVLQNTTYNGSYCYMTAYQLAIGVEQEMRDIVAESDLPFGGEGAGENNSFVSRLAWHLDNKINNGEIRHVERTSLSHLYLSKMEFRRSSSTVVSTNVPTKPHALFRYVTVEE
jgi:hypothetical protein